MMHNNKNDLTDKMFYAFLVIVFMFFGVVIVSKVEESIKMQKRTHINYEK